MKRIGVLLALLSLGISPLLAQGETPGNFTTRHKNIYGSLLGSHLWLGVNFDMRFERGRMDGLGFAIGLGGIGGYQAGSANGATSLSLGMITVPLEINYIVGKRNHSLVGALGVIPGFAAVTGNGNVASITKIYGGPGNGIEVDVESLNLPDDLFEGDWTDVNFTQRNFPTIYGVHGKIGYRYQPDFAGLMLEAAWTPIATIRSGFRVGWFTLGAGIGLKSFNFRW